jgi:hypothetical protein
VVGGDGIFILSSPHISSLVRFARSFFSVRRFIVGGTLFLFCASNVAAFYPEVLELGYVTKLFGRTYVAAFLILVLNLLLLWQIAQALPRAGVELIATRMRERLTVLGRHRVQIVASGRQVHRLSA